MNELKTAAGNRPAGERESTFSTSGSRVRLSITGEALTPYGGKVPWAAYTKHISVPDNLAARLPVERTSPNAAPLCDITQASVLTVLTRGGRLSEIERRWGHPTVPELFGMKAAVTHDTVRRTSRSIRPATGEEWIARNAKPVKVALPDRIIVLSHPIVLPESIDRDGSEGGYNRGRPGRRIFRPPPRTMANVRICPEHRFRAGDSARARDQILALEYAQRWFCDREVWLTPGDIGLSQNEVLAWSEQVSSRPRFLFRLKSTCVVRNPSHAVPEDQWEGPSIFGSTQVGAERIQLTGCKYPRRCMFEPKFQGLIPSAAGGEFWDNNKHEFAVYVTNLPMNHGARVIQRLYRERADTENVFDELKKQWGFSGFCVKSRATTELAARLLQMVYNLWVLFVRFIVPQQHTEAKRRRRWFLLIAARLVQSGLQKEVQVSIRGGWAHQLKDGYLSLHDWIRTTAPQLNRGEAIPSGTGEKSLKITQNRTLN